jgi:hypothetical protein
VVCAEATSPGVRSHPQASRLSPSGGRKVLRGQPDAHGAALPSNSFAHRFYSLPVDRFSPRGPVSSLEYQRGLSVLRSVEIRAGVRGVYGSSGRDRSVRSLRPILWTPWGLTQRLRIDATANPSAAGSLVYLHSMRRVMLCGCGVGDGRDVGVP